MHCIKSSIRSTKAQLVEPDQIQATESNLAQLRKKYKDIYMSIRDTTELAYTDQTEPFQVVSSKGHKYIMVLVDIDSNCIAMEPMHSKETQELINIYNTIMDKLTSSRIKPTKQILDNEAPKEYLKAIEDQQLTWELVPPHNH
jgi:hypothetical protein